MKNHDWVPVVEQAPGAGTTVIVCQPDEEHRIFAGWLDGVDWLSVSADGVSRRGLRVTDFWLSLPEYPAEDNVVRVMRYPA